MIRSDGEGSPWRRCSFTKSASAREAAAVTGETKSEDGAAALCDGHHGASRGGGGGGGGGDGGGEQDLAGQDLHQGLASQLPHQRVLADKESSVLRKLSDI